MPVSSDFGGSAGDLVPVSITTEEDWVRECPVTFKVSVPLPHQRAMRRL